MNECKKCKQKVEAWNELCKSCGYRLVLEPEEKARARYLRAPSVGALFFTQGWAFGSRLYLWFVLSLFPVVGLVVMVVLTLFGRRLSWKQGGWSDFEEFKERMKVLDIIAFVWIGILVASYFIAKYQAV